MGGSKGLPKTTMKGMLLILLVGTGGSALSQTSPAPLAPTLQPSPLPPLVPSFPALPLVPGQPGLTNGTRGGTFSVQTLSQQLTNLEVNLQQVLPALAAFNDSFDFASTLGGQTVPITSGGVPGTTGSNPGNVGGTVPGTPTATNAATAVAGFAAFPLSRDALRALVVLQNDLERSLPLLHALNTGTGLDELGVNPGLVPTGGFTNIFGGTTNFGVSTNGP